MLSCMPRFLRLYDQRGERYEICGGKVYRRYKGVARPLGPACTDYSLSPTDAHRVMQRLGTMAIQWTDGFHDLPNTSWYAVICRTPIDLEALPSKKRREINKGLKNCDVRRIDSEYLSRHGWEAYAKAYERYRGGDAVPAWDEATFRQRILDTKDFADIIHYWAAFCEDQIVAFIIVDVYDHVEAAYVMGKLHPAYARLFPMYALIYRMNEYYLREERFEYVNDGWRSIVHDTNVQDFLEDKFKFHKAYTNLSLMYRPVVSAFVRLTYPFRPVLSRVDKRLRSLYRLEETRRNQTAAAQASMHAPQDAPKCSSD